MAELHYIAPFMQISVQQCFGISAAAFLGLALCNGHTACKSTAARTDSVCGLAYGIRMSSTNTSASLYRCVQMLRRRRVHCRSCLTPFFSAGACVLEASGASCNIDLGLALIAHAHRTPFLLVLNEGLLNVCCFVCISSIMFDPVFLCRG